MTSRELKELLENIRYDWHFSFIEIYRRGGKYYKHEVEHIPNFRGLYLSWESVCGISRFDSKAHREKKCEELYGRYLAYNECTDIIHQYEYYYVVVKDDKVLYDTDELDFEDYDDTYS